MLCWLFNPAVIFISAIWGQLDSLSLLLALTGIVCLLYGRYTLAWTPLAWGCLIKPQLLVILPLIALIILSKERAEAGRSVNLLHSPALRASAAGCLIALVVVSLVCLPFDVGLLPYGLEWSLWERVQFAMDRHNNMVVGGHTIWSLILGVDAINPDSRIAFADLTVKSLAQFLTIMMLVLTGSICLVAKSWRFTLVWGSASALVTVYALPTRIHERYFLPSLLFIVLLSALIPCRKGVVTLIAITSATFLASLLASFTAAYPLGIRLFQSILTMRLLSLSYMVVYACLLLIGLQFTRNQILVRRCASRALG